MHMISRKYDTLLESLFSITNSEKVTSRIVNEFYNTKRVFKPTTYYLGNHVLKRHHLFLMVDTNGTYIISLKENTIDFVIYDLGDIIDYTISYVSVNENISIVGDGNVDIITITTKENDVLIKWK